MNRSARNSRILTTRLNDFVEIGGGGRGATGELINSDNINTYQLIDNSNQTE
jgi:hypothetical protein